MSTVKPFERVGGYTTFENDILDLVMPICSPNVWKIVCATIRKTTGWQKAQDQISVTQYMKMTGIKSRETTSNAIKEALEMGLIGRIKHKRSFLYFLNRDFEIGTDSVTNGGIVTETVTINVTDSVHTKQSKTKRTTVVSPGGDDSPFPDFSKGGGNGTSEEKPTPEKWAWVQEHLRPLAIAFVGEAGRAYEPAHPPNKSERGLWYKEMRLWHQAGATPEDIKRTVQKLRKDGLTVGGVTSVTKTLRDVVAERQGAGQEQERYPKFRAPRPEPA